MLGILVFGGLYQVLPVADLPSVDFPSIRVQASLPGASPETMAASVALPLEKQFTSIAGVTSINSTSTRAAPTSRFSSTSTRTSTPPPRTSSR